MDLSLLSRINGEWTHPGLDVLMVVLTTGGLAWFAVLTLLVWWRGDRQLAWSLLLGQGVALLGVLIFYWLAGRARPDAVRLVIAAPPLPSFPSGHAALAAATAAVWWLHHGWNARTAGMVALAVGVAYSRVYLGHHFPTDVVAGTIMGVGIAAAAHGVSHCWGNARGMVGWLLWPQVSLALLVTMMAYLGLVPLVFLAWPFADKVLHMILIGSLAFWLHLWLPVWQLQFGRLRVPVAIALPFAIAAADEVLQGLSLLRTFDWGDLASDLVGLLAFYLLSRWVAARLDVMVARAGAGHGQPEVAG